MKRFYVYILFILACSSLHAYSGGNVICFYKFGYEILKIDIADVDSIVTLSEDEHPLVKHIEKKNISIVPTGEINSWEATIDVTSPYIVYYQFTSNETNPTELSYEPLTKIQEEDNLYSWSCANLNSESQYYLYLKVQVSEMPIYDKIIIKTGRSLADDPINGLWYTYNLSNATAKVIGNGVKYSGDIVVPESITRNGITYNVTEIDRYTFSNCDNLGTITVGDNVASIGDSAFSSNTPIYVNRGTTALFALWDKGYTNVYDKETGQNLLPLGESTHTASSIHAHPLYLKGPANITTQTLTLNGVTIEGDSLYLSGLNPNTSYTATYTITVDDQYTYTGTTTIKTDALTLTTARPKVINEGNIVVGAASNLDDAETNVGFQWRRTDWSDDFDSKTGGAYLYEGEMQGYIRNLNTNYLWKYRPFYTSDSGTTYYGDWKGIDPTDYSYFDPTVHTYAKTEIEGNAVQLKGYVQRGTDNVTNQGFVYWTTSPQTTSPNPSKGGEMKAPSVPSTAQRVTATGTVMEASLTGLEYNTTYSYVAFVTTSEGETFYGEEQTFTTGEDPTGIEAIHNSQFTIHNSQ